MIYVTYSTRKTPFHFTVHRFEPKLGAKNIGNFQDLVRNDDHLNFFTTKMSYVYYGPKMQKMGKNWGFSFFTQKTPKWGFSDLKKSPQFFFSINAKIWDLGILITFLCAVLYLFQVIKIGQKHLENFLAFWET